MATSGGAGNLPPAAAAAGGNIDLDQWRLIPELVFVTDADGDAILTYQVRDTTAAAGSGYLWADGISYGQGATVTVASLQQTWVRGGSVAGPDVYEVRAFDGIAWGAWTAFTLVTRAQANRAPVGHAFFNAVQVGQTVPVMSLFTVSDADGDALVRYQLWDTKGGGYFRVEGNEQLAEIPIDVLPGQLATTTYVAAGQPANETVWVRAYDGQTWGAWEAWTMFTHDRPGNAPPVVQAADRNIDMMEWRLLNELVTATDPETNGILQYQIRDTTGAADTGYLWVDGAPLDQGVTATTQSLANAWVRGGSATGADTYEVSAFDGISWSAWTAFALTTRVQPNRAPMVSAPDVGLRPNQLIAVATLFSVSDADGDAPFSFELWDGTEGGGDFRIGGAPQSAGRAIPLTPAQLSLTAYVAGPTAGTETLWARAYDGQRWSTWVSWQASTVNGAPVASAPNATLLRGETRLAGTLFAISDADSDPITRYRFWDGGTDGGSFVLDGAAQPAKQSIEITAAELSSLVYRASASPGTETLWVQPFDGYEWGAWEDWLATTIDRPPVVTAAAGSVAWGQSTPVGGLFSAADADGDAIAAYELWDSAGGGTFRIGGVDQPAEQAIPLSAAGLASATYVGGWNADTETVWARAFDGYEWSAWKAWQMTTLGNAPRIVAGAGTAKAGTGKSVPAGSLFTATDADGGTITQYQFWHGAAGGYFAVGGVAQPADTAIAVPAAALGTVTYVGGDDVGPEWVWVRSNDGSGWGPWTSWVMDTVYRFDEQIGTPLNDTIQVSAYDNIYFGLGGDDALTTRFDQESTLMGGPGNDRYQILTGTGRGLVAIVETGGSAGDTLDVGILLRNLGAAIVDSRHLVLTDDSGDQVLVLFDWQLPANRIETFSIPGAAPLSHDQMVSVLAAAGAPNTTWEALGYSTPYIDEALAFYTAHEAALAANAAPTVAFASLSLKSGQTTPIGPLLTVSDANGDPVVAYEFTDNDQGSLTGHFVLDGVVQTAGVPFVVSAADLGKLTWVAGSGGPAGPDNGVEESFSIRARDALQWGAPSTGRIGFYENRSPRWYFPGNTTGGTQVALAPGGAIALGSLFQVGDPDGDAIARYSFYVANFAGDSLQVNGVSQPAGQTISVAAADLASVWYVAPSTPGLFGVSIAAADATGAESTASVGIQVRAAGDRLPEVRSRSASVAPGASRPVTDFFTASDPGGDALTFTFDLVPSASGPQLTLNGVVQSAPFTLDGSALGQAAIVGGSEGTSAFVLVTVSDGGPNAPVVGALISTSSNRPPVVTASDRTLGLGEIVPLGALFAAADPDSGMTGDERYSFFELGWTSPTGLLTRGYSGFTTGVTAGDVRIMRYIAAQAPSIETLEIVADSGVTGGSSGAPVRISLQSGVLPADTVGNTLGTARPILVSGITQTVTEFVTDDDPQDFFRLDVAAAGTLRLSLHGLGGNADLHLLDAGGAILRRSESADAWGESISHAVAPGTYYAQVLASNNESTRYTLGVNIV